MLYAVKLPTSESFMNRPSFLTRNDKIISVKDSMPGVLVSRLKRFR